MSLKGFGTHEGKTECHLEKQDLAVLAESKFFRHFNGVEIVYRTAGKGETEMNEHHNNLRLAKSSALVLQ